VKLFGSPLSPFVRKVRAAIHEMGLDSRIAFTAVTMTPVAPDAVLNRANPLGKIPALELDDGSSLYDSPVICEYLDGVHDRPRLLPPAGPARWQALRRQALADGIMDAGVLVRYEIAVRPEALRWDDWIAAQKGKIARALDSLEAEAGALGGGFDIGRIAIACALGYLDFRFAADRWRDRRPALAAWFETAAKRPSISSTAPELAAT